VKEKS